MTEAQQKRRAVLQARCIRNYTKKLKVSLGSGFNEWVVNGLAKQWADFNDKGNNYG
tara:strand:+ start:1447 stop:1614 length:168 start_codon:yes stop_codon:yes gene_type:complete